MPMVVSPEYKDQFEEPIYQLYESVSDDQTWTALEIAMSDSIRLVNSGVPAEEARQILPNAAAVNIMWTVNARSLLNFFEQRLCNRNVGEMRILANKIWHEVHSYWPDFANLCGPRCYTSGQCNQGRMSCNSFYTEEDR